MVNPMNGLGELQRTVKDALGIVTNGLKKLEEIHHDIKGARLELETANRLRFIELKMPASLQGMAVDDVERNYDAAKEKWRAARPE